MSLIEIAQAQLHDPIHLSGTNLGSTLIADTRAPGQMPVAGRRTGLRLLLNMASDHLFVIFNGQTMMMKNNVKGVIPIDPKDFGIMDAGVEVKPVVKVSGKAVPMRANIAEIAQVGDPTRGIK